MSVQSEDQQYTPSVLSAAADFISKDKLFAAEWHAAVRAIIRQRQAAGQRGSATRVPGGLHPTYIGLQEDNPAKDSKKLVESTMTDAVDAVCVRFLCLH